MNIKRLMVIIGVLTLSVFISCIKGNSKETRGNETIISVSEEDDSMNSIIAESRKTVSEFLKAIDDSSLDKNESSVKYPFETDPGSKTRTEHLWISNISVNNSKYYGIISNDPFYIKDIKMGDTVEFDIHKISDWKYVKDGFLVGGKSIKYFYDRMTSQEKINFESQTGYKFKSNPFQEKK